MPTHLDRDALSYDPDNLPEATDDPTNELPDVADEWLEEGTTAHPLGRQFSTPSQEERASDEEAQRQVDEISPAPTPESTTQTGADVTQQSRRPQGKRGDGGSAGGRGSSASGS